MTYSTDEKIDYIFKELKAQKRARFFNILLKLAVFGFFIYIYTHFIHGVDKEKLTKDASKALGNIIKPIAQDLANDMIKNSAQNLENTSETLLNELKNNPDLINNLK